MENDRKKVFISYSWDNQEHQEWVLKLAADLIKTYGITVILDQYELKAGRDLLHFMESSIEKSDKVLVILTPNYKIKAEARTSGVGYETSMITQELFESPITNVKFIPVLRNGDLSSSSPRFLSSKLYHDMRDDAKYNFQLFDLAKIIYDADLIEKPEEGPIPDFKTKNLDPIIEIANSLKKEEDLNREIDNILHSHEGIRLAQDEIHSIIQDFNAKVELYKTSNLFFAFETNNRDQFLVRDTESTVDFYTNGLNTGYASNVTIRVRYWKGLKSLNPSAFILGDEPKLVRSEEYTFDLNYQKEIVWKNGKNDKSKDEISRDVFTFFIDRMRELKTKKFRGK